VTEALTERLTGIRDGGRKLFVPYVTGGLDGVDAQLLRGLQEAGADAVEVGLPFSDPVMDGPVIQEASRRALEGGTDPDRVLSLVSGAALDVPIIIMTYVNPVLAYGVERFAADVATAGAWGVIVPDLPVDEAGTWREAAGTAGLATVFLAAPNSSPVRLALVAGRSQGFVYCVSTFGVTGAREALSGSAEPVVAALRPLTRSPLLVGVGISRPEQAADACRFADGVVVGTALVQPMLEGDREECLRLAESFRAATVSPSG
jgi:tryptophan synthase alpha chain